MDKITQQTFNRLENLRRDLQKCQQRLVNIGKTNVPIYFGVPNCAGEGFRLVYSALDQMQKELLEDPSYPKG